MSVPGARKEKLGDRLLLRWGAPAIALLLRLLARSLRLQWEGWEHYKHALETGRPLVFAFWHEDLFGIAMARERTRHGEVAVMVSRSRDGEKLARVVERLGMRPVRASSSRGAVQGMLELYHYLRRGAGATAALAPDGPRGPRREVKPGVVMLARRADALIMPVGFAYRRQWVFNSWDKTRLPAPWTRAVIYLGPPIDPRKWPGEAPEQARQLGRLIDALGERAEGALAQARK